MPAYRTPPSLNWLIKKYARAQGEIQDLRRTQSKASARLTQLEAETESLREVLAMHEIQVDPKDIQPKPPRPAKHLLRHGQTTKLALECLRLAKGQLRSTDAIAEHVIVKSELTSTPEVFAAVRQTVKFALIEKARCGLVEREHEPPGNGSFGMGYWRIKS